MMLPERSGKAPNEHRFFPDSLEGRRGISKDLPETSGVLRALERHGYDRSARCRSAIVKSRTHVEQGSSVRFRRGGFAALIGGLLLYTTRQREEPTNQGGVISAHATPAVPGG